MVINLTSITKAAGGISSSTPGVYNPIYGAILWANFNLEANIFGCLPKPCMGQKWLAYFHRKS